MPRRSNQVGPRPCCDFAKEERVAAPDQHQVDDQELAGVAQAVELLREAVAADDVVAQRHGRQGLQRGLDAREGGRDGVIGDDRHRVDVRERVFAAEGGAAALPCRVDGLIFGERPAQHGDQLNARDSVHGPREYVGRAATMAPDG